MAVKTKATAKFWELLEESVIVQSLVTFIMVATIASLSLAPLFLPPMEDGTLQIIPVSNEIWAVTGAIIGYWFGTKKDIAHKKELDAQREQIDRLMEALAAKSCQGS